MLGRALGLTKLYNQVHDPTVTDSASSSCARSTSQIDEAMLSAYGWADLDLQIGHHPTKIGIRWTVSPEAQFELLDRLLIENHRRAASSPLEASGLSVLAATVHPVGSEGGRGRSSTSRNDGRRVTGYDVRADSRTCSSVICSARGTGPTEELPAGHDAGGAVPAGQAGAAPSARPHEPVTNRQAARMTTSRTARSSSRKAASTSPDDAGRRAAPAAAIRSRAMAASSLGLAFAFPPTSTRVAVTASWGRYERGPSETQMTETGRPRTVWRRVPGGGTVEVPARR